MSSGKLRYLLLILPALALALGSLWVLEVMRRSVQDDSPAATDKSVPDYYVEGFRLVAMSPLGQPRYTLTGERLTHLPAENVAVVTHPVMLSLDPGAPTTTIRSDTARVEDESRKVHMIDHVTADRPATPSDPKSDPMHVASSYALVIPDEDLLKTDRAVEITVGDSVLRGTGMVFNNKTRELQLLSRVTGVYRPPPR